jgi:hypothetical protein
MKAELRIGNILEYHGQSVYVLEIKRNGVEFGYFTDSVGFFREYDSKDFPKPITITEEWLLDFDKYIKWKWFGEYYGGYIDFVGDWKLMIRFFGGKFIFYVVTVDKKRDTYSSIKKLNLKIEYVHQLQNLYYSLTNKELK